MKKILIIGIIIYLGFWGRYMWIGSGEIEANQPRKLVGITATPGYCLKCPEYPKYDIKIYEPELIYQECITKAECDCNKIEILEEANMKCLRREREEKLRFQLNCFN